MKIEINKADSRGVADHGWLRSHFSFSFAEYYNPEKIRFGLLRVLNDDVIKGGTGFGMHPHENMEIISIPLEGSLEHRDSMGNRHIIRKGDIQVMSAGSGIVHSEMNPGKEDEGNFLQIWIFPDKKNVEPRYDQKSFGETPPNIITPILSPNSENDTVWIHQQAWFHWLNIEPGSSVTYDIKKEGNGVYLFVVEGSVKLEDHLLNRRDAAGITETNSFTLTADKKSVVLFMEVPMR